jgi:hypothetical protein
MSLVIFMIDIHHAASLPDLYPSPDDDMHVPSSLFHYTAKVHRIKHLISLNRLTNTSKGVEKMDPA